MANLNLQDYERSSVDKIHIQTFLKIEFELDELALALLLARDCFM